MDRISRRLTNIKQDKIKIVHTPPSAQALREGEEVLYNRNGMLIRYRKQNGTLWSSSMTKDGSMYIDKNISIQNDLVIKGGYPYFRKLPAFGAHQTGFSDEQSIANETYTRIKYDIELYDVGGNYDHVSNYQFTAPVSGIYHFNAKLLWDGNATASAGDWPVESSHYISLYKNENSATTTSTTNRMHTSGDKIQGVQTWDGSSLTDTWVFNHLSSDIKLEKNDIIEVFAWQNSGNTQYTYSSTSDEWTSFTGHLITAI